MDVSGFLGSLCGKDGEQKKVKNFCSGKQFFIIMGAITCAANDICSFHHGGLDQ